MRRYLPALLLVVFVVTPFAITGCDLLKKKDADAGDEAGAVVAAAADAGAAAPTDTATPPTTVATALTPTPTTTLRPATDGGVKTDAAAPADAGVKTDAAAPSPTPTLTIPPNLFDGGAFKFDAGGFKPPWVK